MSLHTQTQSAKRSHKLRKEAGQWLRELRESRGLSQRGLAEIVGARNYTFISQLEHGRGRIPPDRYLLWADALGVNPREFVRGLMSFYDPMTYSIIFGRTPRLEVLATSAKHTPVPPLATARMRRQRPSKK